jgi:hypothetical protein
VNQILGDDEPKHIWRKNSWIHRMKKFLKISGITFLVLILALIALPFLFKGKIISMAREEANKNLNATVNFSDDIGINIFSSFLTNSNEIAKLFDIKTKINDENICASRIPNSLYKKHEELSTKGNNKLSIVIACIDNENKFCSN